MCFKTKNASRLGRKNRAVGKLIWADRAVCKCRHPAPPLAAGALQQQKQPPEEAGRRRAQGAPAGSGGHKVFPGRSRLRAAASDIARRHLPGLGEHLLICDALPVEHVLPQEKYRLFKKTRVRCAHHNDPPRDPFYQSDHILSLLEYGTGRGKL